MIKSVTPRAGLRAALALRSHMFAACVVVAGLDAAPAAACAFDMIKPERTTIDWIVEAQTLVLARPDPDNIFAYEVTEVLRDAGDAPAIDHLVNSIDRRRLAIAPSNAVLFAHDGSAWMRLAYVDAPFRDILQTALENSPDWFASMPQSRIDFIERLQKSPDPRHQKIVIGELDKVPYADLRTFDLQITDDELLDLLWGTEGYAYQAILALLLGFSDTSLAHAEIHDYIDRVADWTWAHNLGAFAAALIEMDGVAGVEKLATGMLADPTQPLDKTEQLVMALSVHHALATPDVKAAIQTALDNLLSARPETAALIARQYTLRADWSQAAALAPLVTNRQFQSMQDLLTVSVYVAQARENRTVRSGGGNEG